MNREQDQPREGRGQENEHLLGLFVPGTYLSPLILKSQKNLCLVLQEPLRELFPH